MRDSIIYSSFRALFVTIFTILGIAIGLLLFLILIGIISPSTSEETVTTHFKEQVLPNADWKREIIGKENPVILQVNINGVIGLDGLTTNSIRRLLVESREGGLSNDRVKGILLYINTPGGTADDANGIYDALKEYKATFKTPIYVYTEGLCASGGMLIAAVADKIYAHSGALVGNIGVILPPFWNISKVLEKYEISTLTIYAGKGKDAMNPLQPWAPDESKNFKEVTQNFYDQFVNIVVSNRHQVDRKKLIEEYGAKIFPAAQSKEIGLVDVADATRDGTLRDLVKALAIEDSKYQVIQLESNEWWSSFINTKSPIVSGVFKHRLDLPAEFSPELQGKFLYMYRPN